MRHIYFIVIVLPLLAASQQTQYITDLDACSSLAPCASSGVSYIVQQLTYKDCPAEATALVSCACTKDQNSAAVASSISSNVAQACGTTASEDVNSALTVFSAYCASQAQVTFAGAAAVVVSQYITDIAPISFLAPCASSAVSYIVQGLTYKSCPAVPTALASCACTKDQNSAAVTSSLASNIEQACGTTASEDVNSALSVFSAYCAAKSQINFPGSSLAVVNQYITDIGVISSLAPCASSAVSYIVQGLTYKSCPAPASALISCACLKDQNSVAVSSSLVSNVKGACGTTATEDVSSAIAVFNAYCSMVTYISAGVVTSPSLPQSTAQSNPTPGSSPSNPLTTPQQTSVPILSTSVKPAASSSTNFLTPTTNSNPTVTAASSASSANNSSNLSVGDRAAIAGSTIGGLAIVVAVIVAIYPAEIRRIFAACCCCYLFPSRSEPNYSTDPIYLNHMR